MTKEENTVSVKVELDLVNELLEHTTADTPTEAVERAVQVYPMFGNCDQHLVDQGIIDDDRVDMRYL